MRILVKILIWSLLVGLALTWLGWTPADLLAHVWGLLGLLPAWVAGMAAWAWPYIRQGAVIVVPVAVVVLLLTAFRRHRGGDDRS